MGDGIRAKIITARLIRHAVTAHETPLGAGQHPVNLE